MPKRARVDGSSPSVPTPRKPQKGRTLPRAAATRLTETLKPPFMGLGVSGKTRKTRRKP